MFEGEEQGLGPLGRARAMVVTGCGPPAAVEAGLRWTYNDKVGVLRGEAVGTPGDARPLPPALCPDHSPGATSHQQHLHWSFLRWPHGTTYQTSTSDRANPSDGPAPILATGQASLPS